MTEYTELIRTNKDWRGSVIKRTDKIVHKKNEECYTSFFIHTEELLNYVKINKKINGYEGACKIGYLWIDVDSEDLNNSINSTALILNNLYDKFGLDKYSVVIFFSGAKGFHIGINSVMFGADNIYDVKIPKIAAMMVKDICRIDFEDGKYQDIGFVDYRLYHHTRYFRYKNSINYKTGSYKILVDCEDIFSGNLGRILKASKENINCVEASEFDFSVFNDKLNNLFKRCWDKRNSVEEKVSLKTHKTGTLFSIPEKGSRNDRFYKMGYRLFCNYMLRTDEIVDILNNMYRLSNVDYAIAGIELFDREEFNNCMNSAYKRSKRYEYDLKLKQNKKDEKTIL